MGETCNKETRPVEIDEQSFDEAAARNLEIARLKGWVAEQDVALAGLVDYLEKQRPELFESMDAFLEHFQEVAVTVGRREQLNDLMQHLGEEPQNQK